ATGNYSVTVTDASGATATLSSTITQPEAIVISGTITAASCSGISNGAIDVSVTGGQGTFNYSWNNGATTQDLSGLSSGIYILTVKDGAGCSVQKSFSVTNSSQLLISVTPVLPTCGQANGSINITVTGGNPPYTYTWSNGATTEDLQNLAAGLYKVTVKDSSGCSTELAYNLRENNTLKLNATVTQTSCTDDASGAVDLIVTGGTPPYTYTWSNGVTTEDLSGLTAGLYKVTVTDSNGCTATLQVNVSKKTFQSGAQITQLRCDGEASGSIILNPTGGIAPYTYQWSNESTGNSLTGLPSGAYTVVVTDAEGCTVTFTFVISNPVAITASATVTNSQCNTEGNYSIDLTVNGGKSPYTYTWSNGATTEDLSNVSTGTYTVVIKDANGCSLTKQVAVSGSTSGWACLINQPDSIPTCGSIGNVLSTSVAGATSYQWSVTSTDNQWSITGGSTTASILYIAGGENSSATFTLTIVKDGCTQTCNYTASSCTTGSSGGGNGGEDCDECFDSSITLLSSEGSCKTYKALISTTGECRHELSHWTIAIPCGSLQSYSNSEGWAMEIGKDPTTGLYGLKIDNINGFGNEQATFTVTFTLCSNDYNCSNTLKNWQPVVAYKAGLCVAYDTLNQGDGDGPVVCAYPNPFYGSVHFNWRCDEDDYIELDILDKCGKEVHKVFKGNVEKGQTYSFECTGDNLHDDLYIYRFASTRKKIVYGKLVKKD
ncbi:MAG TPA: SprB repeat-containing protein, partial [Ohtaekwangia sp.]